MSSPGVMPGLLQGISVQARSYPFRRIEASELCPSERLRFRRNPHPRRRSPAGLVPRTLRGLPRRRRQAHSGLRRSSGFGAWLPSAKYRFGTVCLTVSTTFRLRPVGIVKWPDPIPIPVFRKGQLALFVALSTPAVRYFTVIEYHRVVLPFSDRSYGPNPPPIGTRVAWVPARLSKLPLKSKRPPVHGSLRTMYRRPIAYPGINLPRSGSPNALLLRRIGQREK